MQRLSIQIMFSAILVGVLFVPATQAFALTNSWGAQGVRIVDTAGGSNIQGNTNTNNTNTNNNNNQNTGVQFYVQTNDPQDVTSNSATVGGFVSGAGYDARGNVEYGTTQNFGNQTVSVPVGNGSYSQILTGLRPNTTYYYRAVATSGNQISRGITRSFTTGGGTVLGTSTPAPYVKIGFAKYVANISNQNGTTTLVSAAPGDTLRYTIIVSNNGTKDAKNVVVIDQLDQNLTLVASGADTIYDSVTRTLSWNVGTVAAHSYKSMSFDVKVGITDAIITNTATLRGDGISTKTTNKTQVVVAKSGNGEIACAGTSVASTNGNNTNKLNAAGLGFLPQTLAGWFIALLLIAVIIVLVYRLFRRQDPKVVVH